MQASSSHHVGQQYCIGKSSRKNAVNAMTSCQTCHNSPFGDESWTAAISYDAGQASSRDGCPSCGLLARASDMILKELDTKPQEFELHFLWRPDSGYQFLSVSLEHGTSTTSQFFDVYVTEGSLGEAPYWAPIPMSHSSLTTLTVSSGSAHQVFCRR